MTIPFPVKNALKTLSALLDLTTPRLQSLPQTGASGSFSNTREKPFQRIFFDKYSETGRTFSDQTYSLPDSEFYLNISPAEMVFHSAFRDLSPSSSPTTSPAALHTQGLTGRTDTELQPEQEVKEEEERITPSFLIQFMLTTSDPQAASAAAQVLSKLLYHLKRSLHFYPTDSELMEWNISGYSWNEFKYKDLKSSGGIFAYDVFCRSFDGIGKILLEEYRGLGKRGRDQGETRRYPLGSLHANLMETGGREKQGWQKERKENNIEEGLENLIWEPLLIDMIDLLQVSHPVFLV